MLLSSKRYKEISNIVRSFLLSDAVCDVLPIDIFYILKKCRENIRYITYGDYAKLCGSNVDFIIKEFGSEYGFTIYNSDEDNYVIAYNESCDACSVRWTLAHELGHILLEHLKDENYTFETHCAPDSIYESEANFFAKKFLVPFTALDILHKNYILNEQVIMDVFDINYRPAEIILDNYNKLHFYSNDFEMICKFGNAVSEYIDYNNYNSYNDYYNNYDYYSPNERYETFCSSAEYDEIMHRRSIY